MDGQELFDTVARHLFTQGRQSRRAEDDGYCLYRGPDDCKCAAGAVIPDAAYDPRMEGNCIDRVLEAFPGLGHLAPHRPLLRDLQTTHDREENWTDTAAMRAALIHVAFFHGLSPAVLDTLAFPGR